MVDLPTREDYFQVGAGEVFARGAARPKSTRISPEAVHTEGTDINIIIAACSAMADEATRHLALRMAALYLDSAEGEDLDRLVADRFSPTVVRKQAAPAGVPLIFSRIFPQASTAALEIPIGARVRTQTGVEFELLQAATFGTNAIVAAPVLAQAVRAGTSGNVAAGTILQLAQTLQGVQVTNEEPASGGTDVESDDSLRERARDFYRAARRGTLAAIEFGALTVPGVVSATAVELLDADGKPTGHVLVFAADANGQSNSVLAAAVAGALREYRAGGIVVDVVGTAPSYTPISYQISFRPGTDEAAARQQLKQITVAVVNALAPQEPLPVSLLFALARSIPGAIVPSSAIAAPPGDLAPGPGEVLKTRSDLVTVNGV